MTRKLDIGIAGIEPRLRKCKVQYCVILKVAGNSMDDSSYRLNFDPDKKDEIYLYSLKEHP